MSEISRIMQHSNDTQYYAVGLIDRLTDAHSIVIHMKEVSAQYTKTWSSSALASDGHVLANFGDSDDSWTTAYNLFADRLLQTNLIDEAVSILFSVSDSPRIHAWYRWSMRSRRSSKVTATVPVRIFSLSLSDL